MKQVQTKMITVESRGFVMTSRGKVMTPIRTPYRENVDRIWSMLTQDRATVMEHIGNKRIPLNVLNFDTDNSGNQNKQKEAAPTAPEGKTPESSARVVNDITPQDNGVPMRTGDVFSTDPTKVQSHHNPDTPIENPVAEQTPEKVIIEPEKEAAPTAPEGKTPETTEGEKPNAPVNNNQNNNNQQQGNKSQNGGKNNKNKHGNKGNKNNQNNQTQYFPKNADKTESKDEVPANPDGEKEPATEPTTGKDLAVSPESV